MALTRPVHQALPETRLTVLMPTAVPLAQPTSQ
jgi:hypothetical protein